MKVCAARSLLISMTNFAVLAARIGAECPRGSTVRTQSLCWDNSNISCRVPDGKVCLNDSGELAVTKFAVEPVSLLPK